MIGCHHDDGIILKRTVVDGVNHLANAIIDGRDTRQIGLGKHLDRLFAQGARKGVTRKGASLAKLLLDIMLPCLKQGINSLRRKF